MQWSIEFTLTALLVMLGFYGPNGVGNNLYDAHDIKLVIQ